MNYEYSTHRPLLQALVETAKPQLILELGTGMYSTPIFFKAPCKKCIFLENDKEWLARTTSRTDYGDNCKFVLHQLPEGIKLATKLRELNEKQIECINKVYSDLGKEIVELEKELDLKGELKMMFADQYTCCRTLSINSLYPVFDIISYHDCQPAGIEWYEYNKFNKELGQLFNHYMLRSTISWTGCFIRKNLDIENELRKNLGPYIESYTREVRVSPTTMSFVKEARVINSIK